MDAARAAVSSPLLDVSINGARGVLFNVSGGSDLTMWEINEAAKVITESIDREAKVIFGAVHDESLKKGEVKITVIAAGFNQHPSSDEMSGMNNESGVIEEKKSSLWTPRATSSSGMTQLPINENGDEWDAPAFLRRKGK